MINFLLKPTCIFCDELSHRKIDLCLACEKDLPVLQNYCIKCATAITEGQQICGACLASPTLSVKITTLFSYQPPIDQLITRLKFGNNLIGANILGGLMADYLDEQYRNKNKPEIIIPVPLHPDRLRERGYNQALEIAKPIAKKLQIPIDRFSCQRVKNTTPQATLTAKERARNIKRAFKIDNKLSYSYVAVVDDVITTGNTISELCRVLFRAGVSQIDVWCCAKG